MRSVLVAVLIVLAGCSGDAEQPETSDGAPNTLPQLAGFVVDNAIVPIEGAVVAVPSLGVEATTDEDGVYAMDGLPIGEVLVVVVQADGFKPSSKSLTLEQDVSVLLNFTLEPLPVKTPFHRTLTFKGIIGCGVLVKAEGSSHKQNCPGGVAVDERVWEFYADADLAGAVIEVVWDQQSEFAKHLNVTVETVGFGELDEVLFSEEQGSILRAQISNAQAKRFYTDGGKVRVTVDVGRNTADEEADVGAAMAAQQEFEVFASLFYIEPPSPDFTVDAS